MKRLILCFDGTWNAVLDPDTVTNVVKLAQAIRPTASDGIKQVVYYNSGVGSGGTIDRILGGVFGFGLESNVKRALAFLTLNYEVREDADGREKKVFRDGIEYTDGDEIFLFGFSRGAYTARALAGVIGGAGIPKHTDFQDLELLWNHYRIKPRLRHKEVDAIANRAWRPVSAASAFGIPWAPMACLLDLESGR
jgi:uncharacterized protein (DUF2235 family)